MYLTWNLLKLFSFCSFSNGLKAMLCIFFILYVHDVHTWEKCAIKPNQKRYRRNGMTAKPAIYRESLQSGNQTSSRRAEEGIQMENKSFSFSCIHYAASFTVKTCSDICRIGYLTHVNLATIVPQHEFKVSKFYFFFKQGKIKKSTMPGGLNPSPHL